MLEIVEEHGAGRHGAACQLDVQSLLQPLILHQILCHTMPANAGRWQGSFHVVSIPLLAWVAVSVQSYYIAGGMYE